MSNQQAMGLRSRRNKVDHLSGALPDIGQCLASGNGDMAMGFAKAEAGFAFLLALQYSEIDLDKCG